MEIEGSVKACPCGVWGEGHVIKVHTVSSGIKTEMDGYAGVYG